MNIEREFSPISELSMTGKAPEPFLLPETQALIDRSRESPVNPLGDEDRGTIPLVSLLEVPGLGH